MPSDTKGMLDTGRTASWHISMVLDCRLSKRLPSMLKLSVRKNRLEKRYDFEADSVKLAAEIVGVVRGQLERYRREEAREKETRAGLA